MSTEQVLTAIRVIAVITMVLLFVFVGMSSAFGQVLTEPSDDTEGFEVYCNEFGCSDSLDDLPTGPMEELPMTGLPLWTFTVSGLTLTGLGIGMVRAV